MPTIVMTTPTVPTPTDHSTARVIPGTLEMVLFVQVHLKSFIVSVTYSFIPLSVICFVLSKQCAKRLQLPKLVGWLAGWLVGWSVGWLTAACLACRQVCWMVGR